jgi:hypothetical protein
MKHEISKKRLIDFIREEIGTIFSIHYLQKCDMKTLFYMIKLQNSQDLDEKLNDILIKGG